MRKNEDPEEKGWEQHMTTSEQEVWDEAKGDREARVAAG